MPTPRKQPDGSWLVNFGGHGKPRFRRKFKTKNAAQTYIDLVSKSRPDTARSIADLIDSYLRHSELTKAKTHATIRCDRQRLTVFSEWCPVKSPVEITSRVLRDFQGHYFENAPFTNRRTAANKTATWEKYRQTLCAFFNWCIRERVMDDNPLSGQQGKEFKIKNNRQRRPERIFTVGELDKLFEYFDGMGRIEISVFFRILAYTGLRVGEAINLEWKQVKEDRLEIYAPKTDTERTVPLSPKLKEWLGKLERGGTLVIGGSGRLYTESNWWKILREATTACNIPPARLYDFRHTFASHLVMQGVDLATVQKLMGHANITTTMIYAHLAPGHLAGAVDKLPF